MAAPLEVRAPPLDSAHAEKRRRGPHRTGADLSCSPSRWWASGTRPCPSITRFPSVAGPASGLALPIGLRSVRSGLPLRADRQPRGGGGAGQRAALGGPAKELYLPFEDPVVNWCRRDRGRHHLPLERPWLCIGASTTAAPASTALGDAKPEASTARAGDSGPLLIAFAVTMPSCPLRTAGSLTLPRWSRLT